MPDNQAVGKSQPGAVLQSATASSAGREIQRPHKRHLQHDYLRQQSKYAVHFNGWKPKMSSILKALKKLEDDKAAYRTGNLKLDAEILRSENRSRFFSAGVIATSLLMLAGGSGATYFYLKREKAPVISSQQRSPVSVSPVINTVQLPEAVVVVPAEDHKKPANSGAPKPLLQPPPSRNTEKTVSAPGPARTAVATKVADLVKAPKPPLIPVSKTAKDVPALRVNGIAFQNIAADSMAIVNGTPVTNGSVIEGITVEKILKDRVLFQHDGEKFEIQLGQTNR